MHELIVPLSLLAGYGLSVLDEYVTGGWAFVGAGVSVILVAAYRFWPF